MSDKSNRRTSDGSKKKAWISIIAFIVLLAIILAVLLITLTKCDKDNVGDNVNGGNSDNIGGGGSDIVPGGDGDGQGGGNVDTPCTHNIVIDQAVPAGCLTTGLTEGKHCSLCNAVIVEQTEIPALGHSAIVDPEVPADCLNAGLTAGSHCGVCGEVITAQTEISALGHNPVDDPEVPADCLNAGLTAGSHCSVCGTIIDEQDEIPALGHEYSWVDNGDGTCTGTCANDATHVETGNHIDDNTDEICDNCGANMHVHQWGQWTDNGDGTCTGTCEKDSSHVETTDHIDDNADEICDNCYANMNVHVHDWSQWTDNGDGTCTRVCSLDDSHVETGYHTGVEEDCTCDNCGVVNHYTHDGNIHLCDACGNPAFEILVENDQMQEGDKILIGNTNFGQSTGTANGNSFVYFNEVMDFSTEENLGYTVVLGGDSTEGFIDFDKYMLTVEVDPITGYYYFRTNFGKYLGIDESTALMYYENPNENARWRINSHGLGDENGVAYYSEIICVANSVQLTFTSNRRAVIPLLKVSGTAIQIFRGVNTGHKVTYRENGDGATHTINCSICGDISTGECYGGTATCTEPANCIECGGKYGEATHTGMNDCICDVCGFGNHVDSDDNIFDCEVCGGTIPFVNIDTEYLMDGVTVWNNQEAPHAPLQTGDKILMGHTDDYSTGTYVDMYLDFKNEENLGNMVKLGTDTTGMDNPEQYLLDVFKIGDNTYAFRTHFGKYVAMDENGALVYVEEINDYSTWALRSSAFGSDDYKQGLTELTNVATGSLLEFPEDPLDPRKSAMRTVEKEGGIVLYVFRDVNKE